jgi:hypothetical protein
MVPDAYREFFAAEAGATAALTGLLFVAISVAAGRITGPDASLLEQARASSALTCFILPLTLSLVALLPDARITIPAIVTSVGGLLFVVATLRRYFSVPRAKREPLRGLLGLAGFTLVVAVILAYGIASVFEPQSADPISAISGATIASILLGVERAWALIGGRGTGRGSSVRDIVRGDRPET